MQRFAGVFFFLMWLLSVTVSAFITFGLIYVAVHFIHKLW